MNREFTISTGFKLFYSLIAVGMLVFAGYAVSLSKSPNASSIVYLIPIIFVIVGLAILVNLFKSKLIITGDSIIRVNLYGTTEIAIADIKGVRVGRKTAVIESNTPGRKITLASYTDFADSDELNDWLKSNFTDLNAVETESELTTILNDIGIGYTEEDRKAKLDRAKYIAIGYCVGGGIVALLAFISLAGPFGNNVLFTLLALIYPLLGALVIATSNGLIKIVTKKTSPLYHIIIGVELPAIALLATGMSRANILQYNNFFMLAAAILLVFVAIFYFADHTGNNTDMRSKIVILLIFGLIYGVGAVGSINIVCDNSTEQRYSTTVLYEYVRHGKNNSYNLELSAWGPQTQEHTVSVSRSVYNQTPIGATVTIHLHKGFLNIPWYTVTR